MKYFVMPDETLQLDANARKSLRGDFAELSDGYTHYELRGPETGELAVLVPGLTIPLFYWDGVAPTLHARGFGQCPSAHTVAATPTARRASTTRRCSCASSASCSRSSASTRP